MITFNPDPAQVDAWVAKAKGRTHLFAVEFIQDLNEEVVAATPWVTGFLRGSWYASIGSPSGAGGGSRDPSGAGAVARMNLVAATLTLGDVFYAINGANYAVHVEYGTSKMAPRAMVRKTVARAKAIGDAAAARVAAMP